MKIEPPRPSQKAGAQLFGSLSLVGTVLVAISTLLSDPRAPGGGLLGNSSGPSGGIHQPTTSAIRTETKIDGPVTMPDPWRHPVLQYGEAGSCHHQEVEYPVTPPFSSNLGTISQPHWVVRERPIVVATRRRRMSCRKTKVFWPRAAQISERSRTRRSRHREEELAAIPLETVN